MSPHTTPEQEARETIDASLRAAGWTVQSLKEANLSASRGVAIRELHTKQGFADYILYVDRRAVGAVEAKKVGETLTGFERQTGKYANSMLAHLPRVCDPLPFLYQSTGVETRFTNTLDPDPRSRLVFHFHTPDELAAELDGRPQADGRPSSLRSRLQELPPLHEQRL